MGKYFKDFTKTIWGFAEIIADSEAEANAKFENGDYSEFDNKSDYKWEDVSCQD